MSKPFARWRLPDCRGERSPNAKLSAAQVRELRRLAAEEGLSAKELGARFQISANRAGQILRGEAWRHLLTPLAGEAGAA